MALFFWLVSILLITAAAQGNTLTLIRQVESDAAPFFVWIVLIAFMGILRQNGTLRPVANAFLVLIVVAFILRNGQNIATEFGKLLGSNRVGNYVPDIGAGLLDKIRTTA